MAGCAATSGTPVAVTNGTATSSIDFVLTGVVIVFTPVLAPIPGPNVFFYYPFLRLLSHYRAILGAAAGLRSSDVQFKDLPELRSLEDNLSGLTSFLERME